MSALEDVLDRNRQDERRRALRALLARPLLHADHPAFPLVRRHAEALREWLARETGWALQVEADFARLHKAPADHRDATRAAPPDHRRNGTSPFDRRRYALICLALADLERGEGQITLGRIGAAVVEGAAEPVLREAQLRFALETREDRRDLVAVVRLLLALGILSRVAGDEEAYITREKDVLYDVNRRVLSSLLVIARGPSLISPELLAGTLEERLGALTERFIPDTPEARNRALRQNLTRRLLDDPVVYWDALPEGERAYLVSQRAAIAGRIQEAAGLVPEVRAEGLAMVDPAGELTDERMPSEGTEGHVTLLIAEQLARAAGPVPVAELEAAIGQWRDKFRGYWKKAAQAPGSERELCRQALERLAALRLLSIDGERVLPLAAIGRFALDEPTIGGASS